MAGAFRLAQRPAQCKASSSVPWHPCQRPSSLRLTSRGVSLAPRRASAPLLAQSVRKLLGTASSPFTYLSGASRASQPRLPPPSPSPVPPPPHPPAPAPTPTPDPHPQPKKRRRGCGSHRVPRLGAGLHPAASSRVTTSASPSPFLHLSNAGETPPAPLSPALPGRQRRQPEGKCLDHRETSSARRGGRPGFPLPPPPALPGGEGLRSGRASRGEAAGQRSQHPNPEARGPPPASWGGGPGPAPAALSPPARAGAPTHLRRRGEAPAGGGFGVARGCAPSSSPPCPPLGSSTWPLHVALRAAAAALARAESWAPA